MLVILMGSSFPLANTLQPIGNEPIEWLAVAQ